MRLNKFIAQATGMSRRAADTAIEQGRVTLNGQPAKTGQQIDESDTVTLDGSALSPLPAALVTIMLNKPVGYICSRDGQGGKTIYDLLPNNLHHLKPVGRLDKNSSGLLLLTNDGNLAHQLTHPSFKKTKIYNVQLNKSLATEDEAKLRQGVLLNDGLSKFSDMIRISDLEFRVSLEEGRNRQIRRTFSVLGYNVVKLHRTHFGPYTLSSLKIGKYQIIA